MSWMRNGFCSQICSGHCLECLVKTASIKEGGGRGALESMVEVHVYVLTLNSNRNERLGGGGGGR